MTMTTTRCDTKIKNERRGSGGGGGREIGGRNKRGTATDNMIGHDDKMSITTTTAPSLLRTAETVNLMTN